MQVPVSRYQLAPLHQSLHHHQYQTLQMLPCRKHAGCQISSFNIANYQFVSLIVTQVLSPRPRRYQGPTVVLQP